MATEIIHTIKASGGDYTSLSAWEAAQQRDLVSADEIAVAEMYYQSTETTVIINGWTTDAIRKIVIRNAPGNDLDPINKTGTGVISSSGYAFQISHHTTLEGLLLTFSNSFPFYNPSGNDIIVNRCYIDYSATSKLTSHKVELNNCIIDCSSVSFGSDSVIYNSNAVCRNCTLIYDSSYGIGYRSVTTTNCIAYNAAVSQTYGCFFGCSGDYNAATDTSSQGANSIDNITSSAFTNYGSGDYSIPLGSVLIDAGTDLSTEFTTDIVGTVRS